MGKQFMSKKTMADKHKNQPNLIHNFKMQMTITMTSKFYLSDSQNIIMPNETVNYKYGYSLGANKKNNPKPLESNLTYL